MIIFYHQVKTLISFGIRQDWTKILRLCTIVYSDGMHDLPKLLRAFLSNMSKNIAFSISKPNFIIYNTLL